MACKRIKTREGRPAAYWPRSSATGHSSGKYAQQRPDLRQQLEVAEYTYVFFTNLPSVASEELDSHLQAGCMPSLAPGAPYLPRRELEC